MILIITHKNDYTADYIINILNKRNIAYRRLNCEDLLNIDLTIEFGSLNQFSILGCGSFKSVWFRRTKLPEIAGLSASHRIYILKETESLLTNIFEIIDSVWMSNPSAVYKAENKLYQLKVAQRIGFEIPHTIVTNLKTNITSFFSTYKKIVIKPLSGTRIEEFGVPNFIFTNSVSEHHMTSLAEHDLTPCIFQEQIEKDYEVRVTVVGSQVFAAAVQSQLDKETLVDWRRKKLQFHKIEIPSEIAQKCISLVAQLGLLFGAIDIIKTQDGRYIFLEINPNGQWAWIEAETGLPISDAIINTLLS